VGALKYYSLTTYDTFTPYLRYLKKTGESFTPYLPYLEKTGETGEKKTPRSGV
jgi:hypothetical protein